MLDFAPDTVGCPGQSIKGLVLKPGGGLSFRPAIGKEKELSASWREGGVDLTTEVHASAVHWLDPSGVAKLVEPRDVHCSVRLPKKE